jgi:hypothetical protein
MELQFRPDPDCCVYSEKQRNCPKHVEFYSKIKFEKLVYLVGFIIRIYHDARSPECHKKGGHCIFVTNYYSYFISNRI